MGTKWTRTQRRRYQDELQAGVSPDVREIFLRAFRLRRDGVIATTFGEHHEITFSKAFHPLDGDLLEIEYPASYGYFLFGQADGKWVYTTK